MKSFLEEYGFAILAAIVVIVLILMISPVGRVIQSGINGVVVQLSGASSSAMSMADEKLMEGLDAISEDETQRVYLLKNFVIYADAGADAEHNYDSVEGVPEWTMDNWYDFWSYVAIDDNILSSTRESVLPWLNSLHTIYFEVDGRKYNATVDYHPQESTFMFILYPDENSDAEIMIKAYGSRNNFTGSDHSVSLYYEDRYGFMSGENTINDMIENDLAVLDIYNYDPQDDIYFYGYSTVMDPVHYELVHVGKPITISGYCLNSTCSQSISDYSFPKGHTSIYENPFE